MAHPVVHFEIIGRNPDGLRRYYGELFGWSFDTPSPVAPEVSEADSYGFIDLLRSDDGTGIRGGIGGGEGYDIHAIFYVGVADVEAALQRAESLGGIRAMGPATSPNALVVGHLGIPRGPSSASRESVDASALRSLRRTTRSSENLATYASRRRGPAR